MNVVVDDTGQYRYHDDGRLIDDEEFDRIFKAVELLPVDVDAKRVMPSLKDLIAGMSFAMKDIVASGIAIADDAEYERRLGICRECQHLTENGRCANLAKDGVVVANGCGCYMVAKAKFAAMNCPNKKW